MPPNSSVIAESLTASPDLAMPLSPFESSSKAGNSPMKLPFASISSILNCFRNSIVPLRCILVKIVLRPVAIVSALSLVVDRTAVKMPISSLSDCCGSLNWPADAEKTPPARRMTEIRSWDYTANFLDTAFKAPRTFSDSEALILNCAIAAIRPSAVFSISPKEGAREDRAIVRMDAPT